MTTDYSIPPLRDLPTGHLAERKQRLFTEISSEREPRRSRYSFVVSRRRLVAIAGAGVACVAAAAVAATGGWLFSGGGQRVVGVTHVMLHERSWQVTLKQQTQRGTSFLWLQASSGNTTTRPGTAGMSLRVFGPPFAAARVNVPGGQIWAGTTRNTIRSVSITDYADRAYTTSTIAAPHPTKTPYRYWALAISGGAPAASLTTRDINGKTIVWQLRHG